MKDNFNMFMKKVLYTPWHYYFNLKWRKRNSKSLSNINIKNKVRMPIDVVSVGKWTYGNINVMYYKNSKEKLEIGNYCSIAENVVFILGGEHNYKTFSTYPFASKLGVEKFEAFTKGKIIVEDDVWIGYGCTILSGITIGKGAVIGAGSIVSKNVPPYSIFVNGEVIKYRFSKEIIDYLVNIDFTRIDELKLKNNIEEIQKEVLDLKSLRNIIKEVIGE